MLTVPAGVRIYLACGATDMRKGFDSLSVLAQQVLKQQGLAAEQAAAMGDDWPDLPVMRLCALAAAPAQAHAEVLAQAHWVSSRRGGDGAVREFCDVILAAQGHYAQILRSVSAHGVDR